MNYIKVETSRVSYRIVGVFCDFDATEVEDMLNEFYELYQLSEEYLVEDAVLKISVEYSDGAFSGDFIFNVVERIK